MGSPPATATAPSSFGSLLVGRFDGDTLVFAGGVGTGFDQKRLKSLTAQMRALAMSECPFDPLPPAPYRKGATWIRPELCATIEITEFTNDGIVRHASFIELTECAP